MNGQDIGFGIVIIGLIVGLVIWAVSVSRKSNPKPQIEIKEE